LGAGNTAIGFEALHFNTGGNGSTAIGFEALQYNTGQNNIAIGIQAGISNSGTHNDNIYIGHAGFLEDSTIRIGNSFQTRTFVAGISGNNLGAQPAVLVDSNGQLGVNPSSRRFKYDIQDMDETTKSLLRLRPVSFRYKQAQNDGSHPLQYGLIAEEVADVYPELVQNSPEGQPNAVLYHVLPAMLLNEFQKQHRQIEAQKDEIQSLEGQLTELAAQTRQLQTEVAAFKG
jgi:hypothetical protein